MRQKSAFYASANLRRLYKQKIEPTGEVQAAFARRTDIGGQSMLAQIMSGAKPLPIESAPKIAKALKCTIDDICPEMADYIRDDLVPFVGVVRKTLRRAAIVLLAVTSQQFQPTDAEAAVIYHNPFRAHISSAKSLTEYTLSFIRRMSRALQRLTSPLRFSDAPIT